MIHVGYCRELLLRVDRDPQTKKQGRSAFIRDAIELYLAAKQRRDIDRQIASVYGKVSSELLANADAWLREQVWPEK